MNIFLRIITFPLSLLKWILAFYLAVGWKLCKLLSQLAPRRQPDLFDVIEVVFVVALLLGAIFLQLGFIVAAVYGTFHPEVVPACENCHKPHIVQFCIFELAISGMVSVFTIINGCHDEYRALVSRGE